MLAVDDHEDLCELMELFLAQAGFAVTTARSASHAWQALLERGPVDVVVADATLCQKDDGIRLIERALQRFPHLGAIVLSGDVQVRSKALAAGARSVLIKPVQPAQLIAEVRRLSAETY